MKAFWALLTLCITGCAPTFAPGTPEAAVSAFYDPLARSGGKTQTNLMNIPMTEALRQMVYAAGFISDNEYCSLQCKRDTDCISRSRCESSGQPAQLENDVAGFCSDCSGFSELKIATTPDNGLKFPIYPAQIISATFRLADGRARSVYFYMMDSEDGWQVDNIVGPDGRSFRQIAWDKSLGVTTSWSPPPRSN